MVRTHSPEVCYSFSIRFFSISRLDRSLDGLRCYHTYVQQLSKLLINKCESTHRILPKQQLWFYCGLQVHALAYKAFKTTTKPKLFYEYVPPFGWFSQSCVVISSFDHFELLLFSFYTLHASNIQQQPNGAIQWQTWKTWAMTINQGR